MHKKHKTLRIKNSNKHTYFNEIQINIRYQTRSTIRRRRRLSASSGCRSCCRRSRNNRRWSSSRSPCSKTSALPCTWRGWTRSPKTCPQSCSSAVTRLLCSLTARENVSFSNVLILMSFCLSKLLWRFLWFPTQVFV